jgi:hypothetical protein
LIPELEYVLLADFIEEEAFPEFIVVVDVPIEGLAFGRGNAEMLADV